MGDRGINARHANLSGTARRYLKRLGVGVEDLFYHVLATLHDPVYREANAGGLGMGWPRIPLPDWPTGAVEGATEAFARRAARGRELAALLDPDESVPGVTQGPLSPEFAIIAAPATVGGRNMRGNDFIVTADWGHRGQSGAVMPGQGRAVQRPFTVEERATMGHAPAGLDETTFDVYLNDRAFWRNVPSVLWNYKLGGYQVLKKWLSYRERSVLGRPLRSDEVRHFTDVARRIFAILKVTGGGVNKKSHG